MFVAAESRETVPALVAPTVVGQDGSTPLSLAIAQGHTSVVEALLENGAVISPADVTAAEDNDHTDIADVLLTHVRDVRTTECAFRWCVKACGADLGDVSSCWQMAEVARWQGLRSAWIGGVVAVSMSEPL